MNGAQKQHIFNQRESLPQTCSCTAMKTDDQIALYKQHESIKPYLSEYNLALLLTWINLNPNMDK